MVHSTAVKEDNPELAAARARGLKVLRRGELLAAPDEKPFPGGGHRGPRQDLHHRHDRRGPAGRQPRPHRGGGGPLGLPGVQRHPGPGRLLRGRGRRVRRLLHPSLPQITIITNLDREHLDHYRDLAHIQETFAGYLAEAAPGGPGGGLGRRPPPGPGPERLPP